MTPVGEIAALGAFYLTDVNDVIARYGAALEHYAEWVLGRDAFAFVTLGRPEQLDDGSPAGARLRAAAAHWPAALTGIKLELGSANAPTLYVRTLCSWAEGVAWLGSAAAKIPPARTLYGLGFQGDVVKTYALTDDGFISYRFADETLVDPKVYRADVAWDAIAWPDARWASIGALGRKLGFRTAGHIGHLHGAMKVYVERTGAISTDRSFA